VPAEAPKSPAGAKVEQTTMGAKPGATLVESFDGLGGKKYDTTGQLLYGAVANNTVFAGFTGACASTNNGATVVRYDQLADRWLVVMPIFRRSAARPDQPEEWKAGDTVWTAPPGVRIRCVTPSA